MNRLRKIWNKLSPWLALVVTVGFIYGMYEVEVHPRNTCLRCSLPDPQENPNA
jgi:hypothetical protein